MTDSSETSILIAGTGPVGLIAALALGQAGWDVTLAGPFPSDADRRTTALMAPALKVLDGLGVLGAIEAGSTPMRTMRIVDMTGRLIRSPAVTFRATEIGEERFGLNIPNALLVEKLADSVASAKNVKWQRQLVADWSFSTEHAVARLDDGSVVTAKLAVAADGRNSPAREAAGIRATSRELPQHAVVLNFSHSRDHEFTSTEFHTETGPFTQVPLDGRRSSLVWVLRPEQAAEITLLDDRALSLEVERRMQSMLGRVEVQPGRQVYPLSTLQPNRFAAGRVMLVGEAAHVFPPIGAQGLNLGIRDVQDLVAATAKTPDDPGSSQAISTYDRRRRPDVLARSTAVNALNASLLSDLLPAQLLRSVGLNTLSAVSPLRAFVMREGMQPGAGFARIFSALREQIRR